MEMEEIMEGRQLPEDAISEILVRLPVKSIVRFKSVSKNWYALISSSNFVSMHLNHVNSTTTTTTQNDCLDGSIVVNRYLEEEGKFVLTFLCDDEDEPQKPKIELDFVLPVVVFVPYDVSWYGSPEIYGPYNGILCLYLDDVSILLCNPSIREVRFVPAHSVSYPPALMSRSLGWGFGFDPVINDFKVIRIVDLHERDGIDYIHHSYKAEVYDLSTNCWRGVEADCPARVRRSHCCETLFNGAFHWPAVVYEPGPKWVILAFQLSTEEFQIIRLPDVCADAVDVALVLDVFNGSLALILHSFLDEIGPPLNTYIDIWVMKQYGNVQSWTNILVIRTLRSLKIENLLAIRNDGELFLETRQGQLVSFNIYTEEIKEYGIQTRFLRSMRVVFYKESLISVNRGVELQRLT